MGDSCRIRAASYRVYPIRQAFNLNRLVDVRHLVSLLRQLQVRVAPDSVNLPSQGQEKGMGITCGHLHDLKVQSYLRWFKEQVRTVGFLDTQLADMVVATGTNGAIFG